MLPRFYCAELMTVGGTIELPKNINHHAIHVLRLKQGSSIILFNGHGGEFAAQIIQSGRSKTTVKINLHIDIECESPLNMQLVQAICANEKMDWIIQKAVELGVSNVQPVTTQRSIIHLGYERAAKRLQHWQQVAIAACEQCGRNHIPKILPLFSLSGWLESRNNQPRSAYVLSLTATESLRHYIKPPTNHMITLLVGPEGSLVS